MKVKLIIAVLLLPFLAGCFALQEAPEASEPLVAPTVAPVEPTAAPVEEAPTAEPIVEAEPTTAPVEEADPTAEPVEEAAPAGETAVFEIDMSQSEARFLIDEVLRGDDITVVGVTDQVAGQIQLNAADPSTAQIGEILINARTFVTDNEFRNRAIANRILLTSDFELISFLPTEISGLPETITEGESYPLQVAGDLTIIGTTLPVTFETAVTLTSPTTLQGTATTVIQYADFGVTIPASQSVQAVADELTLELDFIAVAP